jgi:hypothetical protein
MSDHELLRQLFYVRIGLGEKVCDQVFDHDFELWRLIHARLNTECCPATGTTEHEHEHEHERGIESCE